jgi:hypothetical protein
MPVGSRVASASPTIESAGPVLHGLKPASWSAAAIWSWKRWCTHPRSPRMVTCAHPRRGIRDRSTSKEVERRAAPHMSCHDLDVELEEFWALIQLLGPARVT